MTNLTRSMMPLIAAVTKLCYYRAALCICVILILDIDYYLLRQSLRTNLFLYLSTFDVCTFVYYVKYSMHQLSILLLCIIPLKLSYL